MDKLLQMIGMAKKAGKVTTGGFLCEKSVKSGESFLVIIASDISANSRKTITDACKNYGVKYVEYADMELLGRCTGSGDRAVVSINDTGFAEAILNKYSV